MSKTCSLIAHLCFIIIIIIIIIVVILLLLIYSLEPLLLIIFCPGCIAVEEFVINLIHILRINGVNAVSEITENEQVHRFGLGVYMSNRLKEADFVLVLCTQGS